MVIWLQTIADRVVDLVDEALKPDIMHWAAIYEARMRVGNKKIFHLEAWVIKVMSLYKVLWLLRLSLSMSNRYPPC